MVPPLKRTARQAWARATRGAIAALRKGYIPNWVSDDFEGAVEALADVANLWAAQEKEESALAQCEDLWQTALELKTLFWPDG